MALTSGKALWSIICGQCVLASDEVVGEELENASSHLREGFSFYKPWSENFHNTWSEKSFLKKEQFIFIEKLGKILNLQSDQAWELFQLFLEYEYRGSSSQLQSTLSSDREESQLLHQVFYFYMSDPLHLLSCRRHILAVDLNHPYENLFKEFIHKVLDPDLSLGAKLINELKKVNTKTAVSAKLSLSDLPINFNYIRVSRQLSAIKHQLATLLVYHGNPETPCTPKNILTLLQLAQGIGLGRELTEGLSENQSLFYQQLDTIDAFHCFLLTLAINSDSDPKNHPLCTPEWIVNINSHIFSMGSKVWHFPVILAWAILQGRRVASDPDTSTDEASKFSRLMQRAIKGNAFSYLYKALQLPAFETDHLLLSMVSSITYSLLCIVGTCLDLDKIGLMNQIQDLAILCLKFGPPSHFFWNETSGGANVLLPSTLESFPHRPLKLLDMSISLASASQQSAEKVVELMKELESFTWSFSTQQLSTVSINGNQCVARTPLRPLPDISIPRECHGIILNPDALSKNEMVIITWNWPVYGWQIIESAFKSIILVTESGNTPDDWTTSIVIRGLRLSSALFRSDPHLQNRHIFQRLLSYAFRLFASESNVSKPVYDLVSALLEFFAEKTKYNGKILWSELSKSPILSTFPEVKSWQNKDFLYNYKAGSARGLICGIEANSGSYSLLKNLCLLVERGINNGISCSNIRGTIVFVLKEVASVMLLWRFRDQNERVRLVHSTLSLLNRVLESETVDIALRNMVAKELSNTNGGAGLALKYVIQSSASIEGALNEPVEWPHSTHASEITKMAKLALSLANRLVSQYLNDSEDLRNFFLEVGNNNQQFDNNNFSRLSFGLVAPSRPPHLALSIAQFSYYRVNPKLTYLALTTLTKLAQAIGVPLVACLGTEADGLRDCLISRLDSATEDLWIKVALLRLLTLSTIHQPGLLRLFFTPPGTILDACINLLESTKQVYSNASEELQLALVRFIAALFTNNFTPATAYLQSKDSFWSAVFHQLTASKVENLDESPEKFVECYGKSGNQVLGSVFRIITVAFYDNSFGKGFREKFNFFFSPHEKFCLIWTRYILNDYLEKYICESANCRNKPEEDCNELLLSYSQFIVVVLSQSKNSLNNHQTKEIILVVIKSLLKLFERDCEDKKSLETIRSTVAEFHLSLVNIRGHVVSNNSDYESFYSRLLEILKIEVMQTSVKSQVLILSAGVKILSAVSIKSKLLLFKKDPVNENFAQILVNNSLDLVQIYCSLAYKVEKSTAAEFNVCTCLVLSCIMLDMCFQALESKEVEEFLQSSSVINSLLFTATRHVELGNSDTVRAILGLLTLIAKKCNYPVELTTESLSQSVSLALASQPETDRNILRDLVWCTIYCLKKKEGIYGLESAVDLLAVHLSCITSAFANPDQQTVLTLAASSLTAVLAPYHKTWRVIHPESFRQILISATSCIHSTTRQLHLRHNQEKEKETFDLKACEDSIDQLLQILGNCLETVRHLSPTLSDVLCCPSSDMLNGQELIQMSVRKHSGNQEVLPNLATLADILDLYHTLAPKDHKHSNSLLQFRPLKADTHTLMRCVEEALYLFLTYSILYVIDPQIQARDSRDIRTFLADETSTFFSQWTGRRTVSTSSPMSPKLPMSDMPFFMLCRQIVNSVCNSTKS